MILPSWSFKPPINSLSTLKSNFKVDPVDFDKSVLMSLSSVWDNSFEEINDALISPLFCEQSLKKLSIILFTKKILLFSINNNKNFWTFFEKFCYRLLNLLTCFAQ